LKLDSTINNKIADIVMFAILLFVVINYKLIWTKAYDIVWSIIFIIYATILIDWNYFYIPNKNLICILKYQC
jgi:hypothetical protein